MLGRVYAWNTAGAIAGSLLGGFLLFPLLGAERLWVLSAGFCALLAVVFLHCHLRFCSREGGGHRCWLRPLPVTTMALLVAALLGVFVAPGPGAYWRHSAIGFGRIDPLPESLTQCLETFAMAEEGVIEEWEGRETSVAVSELASRALLNNGKSDSSLHGDASTTIGLALIPALLQHAGVPDRPAGAGVRCGADSQATHQALQGG